MRIFVELHVVYLNGFGSWHHFIWDTVQNIHRVLIILYRLPYQRYRIIMKQNWNQFLLVVKATALKQQISNFYPQIQRTDAIATTLNFMPVRSLS